MIVVWIIFMALGWTWVWFQIFSLFAADPAEPDSLLGWIWYPVAGLRARSSGYRIDQTPTFSRKPRRGRYGSIPTKVSLGDVRAPKTDLLSQSGRLSRKNKRKDRASS